MAHADVELQLSFLPSETLVWQQGPAIGTGRFGHVVLALRIPSAELLAVKQVFIQEDFEQGNDTSSLCMQRVVPLAKIQREVDIVQSIQHPNVVQCLGCERYGPMYRIFMEFVPAGSLSKLLKELGPFPESAARQFVRQLTEGVAYLHRSGIAHRDLKCANLLLTDDGTVKIADFGSATCATAADPNDDGADEDEFAHQHETAQSVRDGLGSPYWMAPELVRAERGADGWRKADVWGLGCVLVELVTAKPPWDNHSNPLTAMFHIASKDAIPQIPASLTDKAKSFLLCCFDKDPVTRPSAAELLTHPFLTGENDALTRWQTRCAPTNQDVEKSSPNYDAVEKDGQATPRRSSSASSCSDAEKEVPRSSLSSVASQESVDAAEEAAYSSDSDVEGEQRRWSLQAPRDAAPLPVSRRPSAAAFAWREIGRVRALADYTAGDSNELSLKEGHTLIVAGVNEFGWWRGRHAPDYGEGDTVVTAEVGWFPCTYVQWLHSAEPFRVKREYVPTANNEVARLPLSVGEIVDVVHCEWRDDRLWAFGTAINRDGRQGWFPFSCVVDERGQPSQ